MATPRPPQLDAGSKWASPAASIRSLSALLEVGRDVSRAGGATSRAPDAAGEPQDRSTDVAHPAAATCAARFCALQDDRRSPLASAFSNRPPSRSAAAVAAVAAAGQPTRGAEQLQQLTADFKFNLKVCSLQGKRVHAGQAFLAAAVDHHQHGSGQHVR